MESTPSFGAANSFFDDRLLVVTKTYPVPSRDYIETTCVAAINAEGEFRRIYPVPFRLLEAENQFRRWQWITAKIDRASSDLRPESHRVQAESIVLGQKVDTSDGWRERLKWLEPHTYPSFSELDGQRLNDRTSLGVLRPSRPCQLKITPTKEADWTEKRKAAMAHGWAVSQRGCAQTAAAQKTAL